MTIDELSASFRAFKTKAQQSGTGKNRIRYPKKLKSAAIEIYKNNPDLTPSKMAAAIGVSQTSGDKWFKKVKQEASQSKHSRLNASSFVELKPRVIPSSSKTAGELKVRIVELSLPSDLDEAKFYSSLKAIIHGAI